MLHILVNRVGEKSDKLTLSVFSSSHTTERTLVLGGFPKSVAIGGWSLGYIVLVL